MEIKIKIKPEHLKMAHIIIYRHHSTAVVLTTTE